MWLPPLPTASLGLGPSVRLSSETTPCLQATWAITCHWLGRRCFPPGSCPLLTPLPQCWAPRLLWRQQPPSLGSISLCTQCSGPEAQRVWGPWGHLHPQPWRAPGGV